MFNKLLLGLATLGLAVSAPANANTYVKIVVEGREILAPVDSSSYNRTWLHNQKRVVYKQPRCNKNRPFIIRDPDSRQYKCVGRYKWERSKEF